MTKVRFTFVDVQGNPLPLMEFKILLRRASFNIEDVGVALPEELKVVTDDTGQATVDLWPLKAAYRVQIAEEYEEVCGKLNWSFYVPQSEAIVDAQDLFLVPAPSNVPWDEEVIGKINQAVIDSKNSADDAEASAERGELAATTIAGDAEDARNAAISTKADALIATEAAALAQGSIDESAASASSAQQAAAQALANKEATDLAVTSTTQNAVAAVNAATQSIDSADRAELAATTVEADAQSARDSAASAAEDAELANEAISQAQGAKEAAERAEAAAESISGDVVSASESAAAALESKNAAEAASASAGVSVSNALTYRDEAQAAAEISTQKSVEAATSSEESAEQSQLAKRWASDPEDTVIAEGKESAYSYSRKAFDSEASSTAKAGEAINAAAASSQSADVAVTAQEAATAASGVSTAKAGEASQSATTALSEANRAKAEADRAQSAADVYSDVAADLAAVKTYLLAVYASMVDAGLMEATSFLSLDFVSNTYISYGVQKQFGELIEFSRPSGGGIWNSQRNFEWLGTDVPRFEYDPVSGSALGLLVEPQSTNYAINSEILNGETGYSKPLATTQEAFGRGFSRGWSVPKSGSGNYVYHLASAETGQTFISAFVKYPRVPVVGVTASASFDITWRPVSGSSLKVMNYGGLYRLSGQRNINQTLWGLVKYDIGLDGTPVVSGFQEERERVTSYIPTTTAQVTRAADNVFIPNGSWRSPTGRLEVDADEGVTVTLETGGIRIAGLGHIRSLKFYPEVV